MKVMTAEEICREFREAKDKKAQVAILADQNICAKEEILRVLQNNGIDLSEVQPKKGRPKTQRAESTGEKAHARQGEAKPAAGEEMSKEERKSIPEAVLVAIYNRMDELEKQIRDKNIEYEQLADFVQNGWR